MSFYLQKVHGEREDFSCEIPFDLNFAIKLKFEPLPKNLRHPLKVCLGLEKAKRKLKIRFSKILIDLKKKVLINIL